jgi:hypothetical protein
LAELDGHWRGPQFVVLGGIDKPPAFNKRALQPV